MNNLAMRFNTLVIIVLTCVLGIAGLFIYFDNKSTLYEGLEEASNDLIIRMQEGLPPLLWEYEKEQALILVKAVAHAQWVEGIHVKSSDGETFASVRRRSRGTVSGAEDQTQESVQIEEGVIENAEEFRSHSVPLRYEGESNPIGTFTLYANTQKIDALLALKAKQIVIATILIDVFLFFIISFTVNRHILSPFNSLKRTMSEVSSGNLSSYADVFYGEMGDLSNSINAVIKQYKKNIMAISDVSHSIQDESGNLESVAQQVIGGSEDQQRSVDRISVAVSEMSGSSGEVAQHAQSASNTLSEVTHRTNSTRQELESAFKAITVLVDKLEMGVQVIERLNGNVTNIASVLEVIRGIAEQTNLLALNAAIEAARAGEQGRGFAVVADEVRGLASRTQESTEEIHSMIEALKESASEAVSVMQGGRRESELANDEARSAGQKLKDVVESINSVSEMIQQVACAAEEQSTTSCDIDDTVKSLVNTFQASSNSVESVNRVCCGLNSSSQSLAQLLKQFKY